MTIPVKHLPKFKDCVEPVKQETKVEKLSEEEKKILRTIKSIKVIGKLVVSQQNTQKQIDTNVKIFNNVFDNLNRTLRTSYDQITRL